MAGYLSPKHRDDRDALIMGLRVYSLHRYGSVAAAAKKIGMNENDLAKVLRLERPVSLSKLEEIGKAVGLKLSMRWEE